VRSKFGRRVAEVLNRDWLEIALTSLGVLFLGLAATCVWALVTYVVHWNDPETGFPVARGVLQTSKLLGIAVFSVGGIVTFFVGWTLAGSPIRRRLREARGRRHDT
jgi:hypothetical protein